MKIRLLYFALVAEITRCTQEEMEVAGENATTAGAVWQQILKRHPQLAAQDFEPLMAVNQKQATSDLKVREGDEVALFPPVSGG